jgi:hypothetical protein
VHVRPEVPAVGVNVRCARSSDGLSDLRQQRRDSGLPTAAGHVEVSGMRRRVAQQVQRLTSVLRVGDLIELHGHVVCDVDIDLPVGAKCEIVFVYPGGLVFEVRIPGIRET